jgi:hypothetical protein
MVSTALLARTRSERIYLLDFNINSVLMFKNDNKSFSKGSPSVECITEPCDAKIFWYNEKFHSCVVLL